MGSVLSQGEVDALLRGLHGGELDFMDEDEFSERAFVESSSMTGKLKFRYSVQKQKQAKF